MNFHSSDQLDRAGTTLDFQPGNDGLGFLKITDPPVVEQKSGNAPATIDAGTRHAAAVALLGNYMAGSFVTAAEGHGGTLLTQAPQTGQQPLLTHPVP